MPHRSIHRLARQIFKSEQLLLHPPTHHAALPRPPLPAKHARGWTSSASSAYDPTSLTRNIGIIAHIDAGKTTTTERMLYYSGYSRRLGSVDEGSTITDFLPTERARGITIQSAAITLHWPPLPENAAPPSAPSAPSAASEAPPVSRRDITHTITLIDTPGHADFTFEVLRSLRVLDGAIVILDGVSGVESQTEQVWRQASALHLPRLIYVNKLDRDGAAFARSVREVAAKLGAWPVVCHVPWWEDLPGGGKQFVGVGDVVSLRGLRWSGGDGTNVEFYSLDQLRERVPRLAEELVKARAAAVDALSEHDERMVELFLEQDEDPCAIPAHEITASLRRNVLDGTAKLVPVFAGASFRNIGVQPLLDAVNDLFPSPSERPSPTVSTTSPDGTSLNTTLADLSLSASPPKDAPKPGAKPAPASHLQLLACALAFKVVSDPRRGMLTYLRCYHGSIARSSLLYNTSLHTTERAFRLLRMYADDSTDIPSLSTGEIGVVPALKHARTGDTLIVTCGLGAKSAPPAPWKGLSLKPIHVPPPVFFASLEPGSLSEEKAMNENLAVLLREDPSLRVSSDEENGQTLISGMGELHLEIARDRLVGEMKTKASMGAVRVAYRETPVRGSESCRVVFEQEVNGVMRRAGCEASVGPEAETLGDEGEANGYRTTELRDGNTFVVDIEVASHLSASSDFSLPGGLNESTVTESLVTGASAALTAGPRFHVPVHAARVHIRFDPAADFFSMTETNGPAIASAARRATAAALRGLAGDEDKGIGTALMDPLMRVEICVDEENLGSVVSDIGNARGGQILSLDAESDALSSSDGADGDAGAVPEIDVRRVYAPPDPYTSEMSTGGSSDVGNRQRTIRALIPLKEMVGYLNHLRSMTKGRGSFTMSLARFEKMGRQRERNLQREMGML